MLWNRPLKTISTFNSFLYNTKKFKLCIYRIFDNALDKLKTQENSERNNACEKMRSLCISCIKSMWICYRDQTRFFREIRRLETALEVSASQQRLYSRRKYCNNFKTFPSQLLYLQCGKFISTREYTAKNLYQTIRLQEF